MEAERINSEEAQHVNIHSTQLQEDFNEDNPYLEEQPRHHHNPETNTIGVQQTTQQRSATPNNEGEDITDLGLESNQSGLKENNEPQSHEHHTSQPIWSKVFDRVRGSQHNKVFKLPHRRPSNTFYNQVHDGPLGDQEKSSDPNHDPEQNQEAGSDGSGQLHYTKTAAETVHTFLGQNTNSTYSMAAK